MSFTTTTDRRRRKSLTWLVMVGLTVAGVVTGAALLVSAIVGEESVSSAPSAKPTIATSGTSSLTTPPTTATARPIRLLAPTRTVAGVGTGWPGGDLGGLSAAAAYTTSSTIELGVLRRRLDVMYADTPGAASEAAQIVADSVEGRANLGVPPRAPSGEANVSLTPTAISHRSTGSNHIEGYVLVRRQLVTYDGQRLPMDLIPVPFVVERINGDWKLTADGVEWSPPAVPVAGRTPEQEGWDALAPTR